MIVSQLFDVSTDILLRDDLDLDVTDSPSGKELCLSHSLIDLPLQSEIEKFRLVLSTYQDGSGMLDRGDFTLPGWRDFERTVAATFGGTTLENKWIYDVLIEREHGKDLIGISYRMRGTLRAVQRKNHVTIELSNASGEFWDSIKEKGFSQESYEEYPDQIGAILIDIDEGWHSSVGIENGGTIDATHS